MAERKQCTVKGCETLQWTGGFCWKHHPKHAKEKKPESVMRSTPTAAERATVISKPVKTIISDNKPTEKPVIPKVPEEKVISKNGLIVLNLMDVINQELNAQREAIARLLSETDDPYDQMALTMAVIEDLRTISRGGANHATL